MNNIILSIIILVIIGTAILYIIKARKSGVKCIGCPASKSCASNKRHMNNEIDLNKYNCNCGCNSDKK